MTAQPVLTEEELAALVAGAMDASWLDLSRRPLPAVLATDFIRTGCTTNSATAYRRGR